jgi:predicted transposase YbfD/YdcC
MDHATAAVLAQADVDHTTNEIARFRPLLERLDLTDAVITADALPTQREHANWLVTHKHADDLLLLVKANQPTLHRQLQRLPWPQVPVADHTHNRGHGRVEVRRLRVTTIAGLDFPHATQTLRITRRVRPLHGRRWRTVTVYAITSLTAAQARPARRADHIRGHWGIEALHTSATSPSPRTPHRSAPAPPPAPWPACATSPSPPWVPMATAPSPPPCVTTPATPPASYPCSASSAREPTSPHLPRPWDRGCRVAERSYLMLWLSLAHAQGLGSRTCRQERRASKSRIGLVRPGNSMAPSPSKRTPATQVIATTGSLTST